MTQARLHDRSKKHPPAADKSIDTCKNKDNKSRFFHVVAALANPDLPNQDFGLGEPSLLSPRSEFLEPAYQELAYSFYASFRPLLRSHVDRAHYASALSKLERVFGLDAQPFLDVEAIFNKENPSSNNLSQLFQQPLRDVYRNGVVFFAGEIASLLFAFSGFAEADTGLKNRLWPYDRTMSAQEFHQAFTAVMVADNHKSFVFSAKIGDEVKNFTIDRANLHCAYRLMKKSGQKSSGIEPNIKYFHAELLDSANLKNKFTLVYWLKLDGRGEVVAGDFLSVQDQDKPQVSALKLWIIHENILQNLVNASFDSSLELNFSKVLGLYADALL